VASMLCAQVCRCGSLCASHCQQRSSQHCNCTASQVVRCCCCTLLLHHKLAPEQAGTSAVCKTASFLGVGQLVSGVAVLRCVIRRKRNVWKHPVTKLPIGAAAYNCAQMLGMLIMHHPQHEPNYLIAISIRSSV
jgi:hypothetical protein